MTDKRFIGNFQGNMLVSIKDKNSDKNVNILQIVEIANQLYDENEELKKDNKRLRECINEIYTIARLEEA